MEVRENNSVGLPIHETAILSNAHTHTNMTIEFSYDMCWLYFYLRHFDINPKCNKTPSRTEIYYRKDKPRVLRLDISFKVMLCRLFETSSLTTLDARPVLTTVCSLICCSRGKSEVACYCPGYRLLSLLTRQSNYL